MPRRFWASAAAVAAALGGVAVGACSSGDPDGDEARLAVYVSMPLRGASEVAGRDVVRGAKLALEAAKGQSGGVAVRAIYMDDTQGRGPTAAWEPPVAAANARRAVEDSSAIAYIGELESGATRASLPITNAAGILQVSPGSPAPGLVARFEGSDEVPEEVQASGERTFGRLVSPVSGGRPRLDPAASRRFRAAYRRRFGERPSLESALGHESMSVVLESLARAGDPTDRAAVVSAFLDTSGRRSVLGTYSVDELGQAIYR